MIATGIRLPGYEIGDVLCRAAGRVALRGLRLADGAMVDLVTLDTEYPDRQQVAELKRDGTIAGKLSDVEGVLKVLALLPHGSGNLALVCEPMASPLKRRLAETQGQGLPLREVLDIAWRLARTLGAIHSREIVHKALTPGRVLLDPVSGEIRLAGFGFASELEQERLGAQMSRRLEGPLPYISPEQTGRMSRDLDYRSDYYSLGVMLFELLTGQRPFQADSVLEWVYNHISRLPPSPRELLPEVPEAVSAIVLKLLAKNPEERYQSAAGLQADLARCADELATRGSIEPFALGQRDLARMTRWADNCEANFRHLQYLMEAELARLDSAQETALKRYDAAIDTARESGFLRDEATACERAAHHLLALGHRRAAEGYLRGAHRLYNRWGAQRKVTLLERRFPVLRELGGAASPPAAAGGQPWDLDLASVMKASRVRSPERRRLPGGCGRNSASTVAAAGRSGCPLRR